MEMQRMMCHKVFETFSVKMFNALGVFQENVI